MVPMAIIMLIMTAPEKVITRMEPNVVTMTSKMHVWLNVESAGTKLVTPEACTGNDTYHFHLRHKKVYEKFI